MEMALQVVGMKLTGKLDDAKQIAMRIVTSNQQALRTTVGGPTQNTYYFTPL